MDLAFVTHSFSPPPALRSAALLPFASLSAPNPPSMAHVPLQCSMFMCRNSSASHAYGKNDVFSVPDFFSSEDASNSTRAALTSSSNEETNLSCSANNLVKSLEMVEVLDLSGNRVQLVNLWKGRTAVVGFARHFGCILCRKRADILSSRKKDMDAAGVALVLIGPGNVDQARVFVQQTNFPGEVYADPSHGAYKSLDFVSSLSSTFTPKAAWRLVTAHVEGYRQNWALSFQKDTVLRGGGQQGGILVAGPGIDRIIYLHKDKEAGDEPDIEDVISACCRY